MQPIWMGLIAFETSVDVAKPETMEDERDDGAEVAERADTVKHAELAIERFHSIRSLVIVPNRQGSPGIHGDKEIRKTHGWVTVGLAFFLLEPVALEHGPKEAFTVRDISVPADQHALLTGS
jgi:hypothetical protein